jgi:hypothetical protein
MSGPGTLDQLRCWFEKCGVPVDETISRKGELAKFEDRTGLTLPHDFREYLLELSPSVDNYDDEETNWWPIARMRTIPEEYDHDVYNAEIAAARYSYLFFADFSIWAWAWAISCTGDHNRGRIVRIGGSPSEDRFVAESFHAFVKIYLRDPFLL